MGVYRVRRTGLHLVLVDFYFRPPHSGDGVKTHATIVLSLDSFGGGGTGGGYVLTEFDVLFPKKFSHPLDLSFTPYAVLLTHHFDFGPLLIPLDRTSGSITFISRESGKWGKDEPIREGGVGSPKSNPQ